MIKTFINPHPINFCTHITTSKAGKGAVMAAYARLSTAPEAGYAEGFLEFSEKDLGILLREMSAI